MAKLKISLLLLSLLVFGIFTFFSYSVAKEQWQKLDFDTTVKLQDHISRAFDPYFSYFSILGGVEITLGLVGILAFLALIRLRILSFLAWLLVIPATIFEVFGKLVVFHPAPPVLFHRNIFEHELPKYYIHTNFSYPSGHMTRTIFILTVFLVVVTFSWKNGLNKTLAAAIVLLFGFMMVLTRIYLGEHWLSDVIGGILLGFSTGLFSSIFILKNGRNQS